MSLTGSIDLGRGFVMQTPVGLASGTAGYGFELAQLADLSSVGALFTKGTTPLARRGNEPPRVAETVGGMLNSIGLQNPGVDVVAADYAPRFASLGLPVVINVAGGTVDDYVHCVRRLEAAPNIAGIELNISCPNIASGLDYGRDAGAAGRLVERVRSATVRHLMVKLSPNVTDIAAVARAVEQAGADSLSAVNTYVGMKIDRGSGRPVLGQGTGGLSGPAIHPLAIAAVASVVSAVNIPVVGAGGVDSTEAALDFFDVGAAAVQVGTHNFVDPECAPRIATALSSRVVQRTAVRVVLLDEEDRILLLHYKPPDTGEDFWCTPGGAVEGGETLEEAAVRELAEETGHSLTGVGAAAWRRVHAFRIGDGRRFRQVEHYHVRRVTHFEPTPRSLGEFEAGAIDGHRWWTVQELSATAATLQPPDLPRRVAGLLHSGAAGPAGSVA
ncbi:MAG: dihydroorotate dehydrogenase [Candidatus Dormibacteraeota bacterium]|nr:dihydroorotate dehydrogenase [Candidatus Dormibacteraeota bacterium]